MHGKGDGKMTGLKKNAVCFLALILMSGFVFSGCAREGNENPGNNEVVVDSGSNEPVKESRDSGSGDEERELIIYTMNYDTKEVEDTVAYVPQNQEITASLVAETVVDNLSDYGVEINLNSVDVENENAVVDIKSTEDGGIYEDSSKKVEETVLNCISYSILDNVSDVNGIIFRIDGEAYKTEYFSFEKDQVYSWK